LAESFQGLPRYLSEPFSSFDVCGIPRQNIQYEVDLPIQNSDKHCLATDMIFSDGLNQRR
jgi:hypothetical protein